MKPQPPFTTGIRTALRSGLAAAWGHRRAVAILYLATLLLAALAALPFRAWLLRDAGHSLMLRDIVSGFNYTFLNDFILNYGAGLAPVLNQSVLLLGVYLLLMVFLNGGLVHGLWVQPAHYQSAVFWAGCGRFFGPLLRLTVVFFGLHTLVLGLFLALYAVATRIYAPHLIANEGIFTSTLRWLVPVYWAVAAVFFLWQDIAKLTLIRTGGTVWAAFRQSARELWTHFRLAYATYLLGGVALGVLLGTNYLITTAFAVDSGFTIALSFLITQVVICLRYTLRVALLGALRGILSPAADGTITP